MSRFFCPKIGRKLEGPCLKPLSESGIVVLGSRGLHMQGDEPMVTGGLDGEAENIRKPEGLGIPWEWLTR